MKFHIVRVVTDERIETVEFESFNAVCKYVERWYDDGDVDIYYADMSDLMEKHDK